MSSIAYLKSFTFIRLRLCILGPCSKIIKTPKKLILHLYQTKPNQTKPNQTKSYICTKPNQIIHLYQTKPNPASEPNQTKSNLIFLNLNFVIWDRLYIANLNNFHANRVSEFCSRVLDSHFLDFFIVKIIHCANNGKDGMINIIAIVDNLNNQGKRGRGVILFNFRDCL